MANNPNTSAFSPVEQAKPKQTKPRDMSQVGKPLARPLGALAPFGVSLTIHDVNDKVQQITDAHVRAFGYKPSPGLVFDLLRGDNTLRQNGVDYSSLFGIPRSHREAQAMVVARNVNLDPIASLPVMDTAKGRRDAAQVLIQRADAAARQGNWADFVHDHADEIMQLTDDPAYRKRIAQIMLLGQEQPRYKEQRYTQQAAAFPGSGVLINAASILPLAASQIVQTGADLPFGAYKIGSAVGFDTRDLVTLRDLTPSRTATIGKQMVKATVYDLTHPLENPGYLAMDVWGLVSLGAGTAARLSAGARAAAETGALVRGAARAESATLAERLARDPVDPATGTRLPDSIVEAWRDVYDTPVSSQIRADFGGKKLNREQAPPEVLHQHALISVKAMLKYDKMLTPDEKAAVKRFIASEQGDNFVNTKAAYRGVRAFTSTAIKKPAPQSFELGLGSYTEMVPLSDSAAVRVFQRQILRKRQSELEKRYESALEGQMVPAYERNSTVYDALLNSETYLKSKRQQRMEIEYGVAMAPVIEMQRLARADARFRTVFTTIAKNPKLAGSIKGMRARQRLAIDKALQVIMTDDPDPVATWRAFHEREINDLIEHKRKIDEGEINPGEKAKPRVILAINQALGSHKAQLEALSLAEKVIANPPKHLKPLLDQAINVSKEQERLKGVFLGLDDDIAAQHLAEIGSILRGERIIDIGEKELPSGEKVTIKGTVTREDAPKVQKRLKTRTNKVKIARKELEDMKRKNRLQPDNTVFAGEVERLTAKVEEAERKLGITERQWEKIKSEAEPLRPRMLREPTRVSHDRAFKDIESDLDGLRNYVESPEDIAIYREALHQNYNKIVKPKAKALAEKLKKYGATVEPRLSRDDIEHLSLGDESSITFHVRIGSGEDAPGFTVFQRPDGSRVVEDVLDVGDTDFFPNKTIEDRYFSAIESVRGNVDQTGYVTLHRGMSDAEFEKWKAGEEVSVGKFFTSERTSQYASDVQGEFPHLRTFKVARAAVVETSPGQYQITRSSRLSGAKIEPTESATGMRGQVEQVERLREGTPGSAYYPFEREVYRQSRGVRGTGAFTQRFSRYGVRPPEDLASLYEMTGDAIRYGDFRWDTVDLLTDQYAKVVKATSQWRLWRDLWDMGEGVEYKASPYHRPIRDIRSVPESLKRTVLALERKEITPQLADYLTEERLDELRKHLFPDERDLEKNPHVRWVDERLIMNRVGGTDTQFWRQVDDVMGRIFTPVNEPMRLLLIFASPAYALNALGNAGLMLIHQGFLAPASLGRSFAANTIYGREVTNILDALAGSTHTGSLVSEAGKFTKFSQKFMEGWQKVTDTYFRRAAIIYELRRRGILTDDISAEELLTRLQSDDPKVKQALIDAGERGRAHMLDFNKMTWPERATLRHILFVYSFLRASTLYSIKFYVEHPVIAGTLAKSGADRKAQIDKLVGKMPEWFYRHGYMAVAEGTVFDPVQFNLPGMLNDIAYPLASLFSDVPYASLSDLLGPSATAFTELATGKNLQGEDLPNAPTGGRFGDTILSLMRETPIGFAYQRIQKAKKEKQQPLKPPGISSSPLNPIAAATQRERSGSRQSVLENDGFWNTWGLVVGRTAVPREVNRVAGEARYWRDLKANDIDAYYQHQRQAVDQMIDRQEQAMGESAPAGVRASVDMIARVSQAIDRYRLDHPQHRNPGPRQVGLVVIDSLKEQGRINDAEAKEWKKKVLAASKRNAKIVYTQAIWQNGGEDWKRWVDQVNAVNWYTKDAFADTVHQLRDAGLGDYSEAVSAPREAKWEYGRRALRFADQVKTLRAAIDHATGYDRQLAQADLNDFLDENSHPVKAGGKRFPPLAAIAYGKLTPQQQQEHLISVMQRKWSDLSAFDKSLIYKTPDPTASEGWRALYQALKEDANAHNGRAQPGYKKFAGDYLAAKMAGFKGDYQFANQTLAARMLQFKPIRQSKYSSDWNWLLTTANDLYKGYRKAGWPQAALQRDFAKRMVPWLQGKIAERSPGFQNEVNAYMENHPHMLANLVRP